MKQVCKPLKSNKIQILIIVLSTLMVTVVSCKDDTIDEPIVTEEADGDIMIKIDHVYENEPLVFRSSSYTLPSGEDFVPVRLGYVMSNFYLINDQGNKTELSNHYGVIDARKGHDTLSLRGVEPGKYDAIGFEIGLNDDVNFGNPNVWKAEDAMNPTNHTLYWGWAGGYIFMALEGNTTVDGKNQSVVYHIAGEAYRNTVEVPLSQALEYDGSETPLNLQFDMKSLFQSVTMADMGYFSHSGDTSLMPFVRNYEDAFSAK
jgi:hypothetical protein